MPDPDWLAQLPPDVAGHVRKLLPLPNFPLQLAHFALVLKKISANKKDTAGILAEQARRLAPDDSAVRFHTGWHFENRIQGWHYSIINDSARNELYEKALNRHMKPGMTVFEVGTGSGILAMLAARAGAGHVYTCEVEPLLVEVARKNIARNGLTDRITVINKRSNEVILGEDMPVRADLFVAEIVDDLLLAQDVLRIMADVNARLLKPGAILLPDQIELRGTLVGGPEWTRGFRAQPTCGLDVSALDWLAPASFRYNNALEPHLAEELTLLHFDLTKAADYQPAQKAFTVKAKEPGVADGFLHWIWMRFGAGLEFSSRPPVQSCWKSEIHVFPKPVPLVPGQVVNMHLQHDYESIQIWPETSPGSKAVAHKQP